MEKWLTLDQIAKYLQMSTSSIYIYKMARAGKIPAYKVDRQWRFKKEKINSLVERNKFKRIEK